MNQRLILHALILMCLGITSCEETDAKRFDPALARAEILELERKQQTFHLSENAADFVNLFSDHYLSINRGKIELPSREKSLDRFRSYFNQVAFQHWDDIQPPLVRFSDDGSIAYVAVDKQVVLTYQDDLGQSRLDSTHFAWLTIYKKTGATWKIDCVASTQQDKP